MDTNLTFLRNKIHSYEIDKEHIIRHMKECEDRSEKERLGEVLDDICNNLDNYQALFDMYYRRV